MGLESVGEDIRNWWRDRKDAQRSAAEAQRLRKARAGSVLMTQVQALTAATWAVRGGDDVPRPDEDLRRLFLANTIALGFGPRSRDADDRRIWELIAFELDASPIANYPTVLQNSMNIIRDSGHGEILPQPPGYEFWAQIEVADSDMSLLVVNLRNLTFAHQDDVPTMFLRQLGSLFGHADPSGLREAFVLLLLHAGFTIKTVLDDIDDVPQDEKKERLELAFAYEGRLLALAKTMFDLSKRTKMSGAYCVDGPGPGTSQ